jgi:SAM-dependent methyltransferase
VTTCAIDPRHGAARYLFDRNGYQISRCAGCGLLMAQAPFEPGQYESDSYYTMQWPDQATLYAHWAFRWRWIARQITKLKPNGHILDVGAGNGSFVKIAREEYALRAIGIEPSKAETEFARRVLGEDLCCQTVESVTGKFDAVTSFNVIEHVTDPLTMLREMAKRTKQAGLIVLTTPSPSSVQARVKGLDNWAMICPPHHLNIFPLAALRQSLMCVGFEIVRHDTLSTYVNFARKIDGRTNVLRGLVFQSFRLLGIGADHFVIARRMS